MTKYSAFYFRFYLTNVFEISTSDLGRFVVYVVYQNQTPQNNFVSKLQPLLNQVLR